MEIQEVKSKEDLYTCFFFFFCLISTMWLSQLNQNTEK